MKEAIRQNSFKLSITECVISTQLVETGKYKTVLYTDQFGEIESHTADSKQEALQLHKLLVEKWQAKLANSEYFSSVKIA